MRSAKQYCCCALLVLLLTTKTTTAGAEAPSDDVDPSSKLRGNVPSNSGNRVLLFDEVSDEERERQMRAFALGTIGSIPYVGPPVQMLTDVFWPPNKVDLWTEIAENVGQLIDSKLDEQYLRDCQEALNSVHHSVEVVAQTAAENQPLTLEPLLNIFMVGIMNTLDMTDNGNQMGRKIATVEMAISFAHLHLTILRERYVFGPSMYDVDDSDLWEAEFLHFAKIYDDYFVLVEANWIHWRYVAEYKGETVSASEYTDITDRLREERSRKLEPVLFLEGKSKLFLPKRDERCPRQELFHQGKCQDMLSCSKNSDCDATMRCLHDGKGQFGICSNRQMTYNDAVVLAYSRFFSLTDFCGWYGCRVLRADDNTNALTNGEARIPRFEHGLGYERTLSPIQRMYIRPPRDVYDQKKNTCVAYGDEVHLAISNDIDNEQYGPYGSHVLQVSGNQMYFGHGKKAVSLVLLKPDGSIDGGSCVDYGVPVKLQLQNQPNKFLQMTDDRYLYTTSNSGDSFYFRAWF